MAAPSVTCSDLTKLKKYIAEKIIVNRGFGGNFAANRTSGRRKGKYTAN
jgi:hypothetical protein